MLLQVNNLSVRLTTDRGSFYAVEGVSFAIEQGKTLALVGESACGKTMTALSLLRLTPSGTRMEAGGIHLDSRDLTRLSDTEITAVRGKEIGMVFQEPLTSLNPVYSIGEQIAESVRRHEKLGHRASWERAVATLAEVGMPDPRQRAREYPHQLSGGMRQRAMIAMAIVCGPSLLVADEPTTALDVSVQAQILDLLLRLQQDRSMSLLLITHDLGIVAEMAHEVAIMYVGQIVEQAEVRTLFARPLHPYTRGLLSSIPRLEQPSQSRRLQAIEGAVPGEMSRPQGCRFLPRCVRAMEKCQEPQELVTFDATHTARCCRAKEWSDASA